MNQESLCQEYALSTQKTVLFEGHISKKKPMFLKEKNVIFPKFSANSSLVCTTMLAEYGSTNLETISLTFSQMKRGRQLV